MPTNGGGKSDMDQSMHWPETQIHGFLMLCYNLQEVICRHNLVLMDAFALTGRLFWQVQVEGVGQREGFRAANVPLSKRNRDFTILQLSL